MELFNADCLEKLKDIGDDSVDLICCDLPYGQTKATWDTAIDLDELWVQLKRVRKNTTPIFMFGTLKFGLELIASNKKEFKYELVWEKVSPTGFLMSKKRPLVSHEYIFVFYKKQTLYDLNSNHKITIKERNDPKRKEGDLYGCGSVNKLNVYEPRLLKSIWEFNKKKNKINSTAKPIDLLKRILKYYSKEGDVVLDPTMGSGTMIIACNQMKRKSIGIELNKDMYDNAVKFIGEN